MPAYSMRSFSILLIAQSISMFGNSLTSFALGVWVFKEVGSATIYALIALANTIPMVLLSPIAGAVVDRMNRKIIILAAQMAAMSITALLMLLYSMDALQPWHIIALVALNSVFLAFVFPAVTATTPLMVPKEQLIRANGMISLAMGIIQLISPAVSGSLYEDMGLTLIFSIDLTGYVVAIIAVTLTFIPQPCPVETAKNKDENMFTAIREGWQYLNNNPGLMYLMLFYSVVVSMLVSMSIMLQPMILAFTDAKTLGFIMSFAGGGMLFGSALMIVLKNINRHMPMIFVTTFTAGLLSAIAPTSQTPWFLALCGFLILSCFPIYDTNNRALLQRKVHSNMIGRVIGLRNFVLGICNGLVLMASGLLSDKILNPAMLDNGWLAPYVGNIFGTGHGRGIALMISILGFCTFMMGLLIWLIKSVRQLDTTLVDVETPIMEEDAILKVHA